MKVLIHRDQIAGRVREMAAAINTDTGGGNELAVLAVLDGAFIFCADLLRHLDGPVRLALVPATSVARGGDPSAIRLPEGFTVRGADLLVVEDILDTGRTLERLTARLRELRPRRLRIAVLLDKPSRREVEVRADYTGFQVPDRWVVGYGLDHDGRHRNLSDLVVLED